MFDEMKKNITIEKFGFNVRTFLYFLPTLLGAIGLYRIGGIDGESMAFLTKLHPLLFPVSIFIILSFILYIYLITGKVLVLLYDSHSRYGYGALVLRMLFLFFFVSFQDPFLFQYMAAFLLLFALYFVFVYRACQRAFWLSIKTALLSILGIPMMLIVLFALQMLSMFIYYIQTSLGG